MREAGLCGGLRVSGVDLAREGDMIFIPKGAGISFLKKRRGGFVRGGEAGRGELNSNSLGGAHNQGQEIMNVSWALLPKPTGVHVICSYSGYCLCTSGPDVGGVAAPYRQSERTAIYKQYVDDLVSRGLAYPCFCTDEELEAMKKEAEEKKLPPVYR